MPNVIVADNDLVVRGVLRSLLESVGQAVFLATCGEEVLDVATRVRASLVLLDLNMPRLNGLLTCEKLRRLPDYAGVPIVILSAYDEPRSKRAASRVGATLFLSKPFQPAVLLQALSPYLKIGVTAQKAISHAATRAREIAPLADGGGKAGARAG